MHLIKNDCPAYLLSDESSYQSSSSFNIHLLEFNDHMQSCQMFLKCTGNQ